MVVHGSGVHGSGSGGGGTAAVVAACGYAPWCYFSIINFF